MASYSIPNAGIRGFTLGEFGPLFADVMVQALASLKAAGKIYDLLSKATQKATLDIISKKYRNTLKHKATKIIDLCLAIHGDNDRVKSLMARDGKRLSKQSSLSQSRRVCPNHGFGMA
jgi:hypothetical protein